MHALGWVILLAVWCGVPIAVGKRLKHLRREEDRARFFASMRSYGGPKC